MSVFLFFALAVVVGTLSTLFWIPEDDLGRGYFQMNALVVLGLLSLVVTVVLVHPFRPFGESDAAELRGQGLLWAGFGASFLYYMAVWRQRWRLSRVMAGAALIACVLALLLSGEAVIAGPAPLPQRPALIAASLLTSSLLLGWSLVTMLLGHWYLVAPGLAFRHLVVFCWVLLVTVVLRLVAVGGTLASAAGVDPMIDPHPLRSLTLLEGQGMFFWFRLLWGLLIPLLLAVMSLHCARQRSNQSATGILYVLVVGTFIGEMTAFYLSITTGVPA